VAFHSALYAASGNPLIGQSAQLHWVHLRRVMGAVLQHARQREALWDEHAAIAVAIGRGDAEQATRLVDQHGRQASTNLLARLHDVLDRTDTTPMSATTSKGTR
jgi:DNA-binding FadR family transcriptional regulator